MHDMVQRWDRIRSKNGVSLGDDSSSFSFSFPLRLYQRLLLSLLHLRIDQFQRMRDMRPGPFQR